MDVGPKQLTRLPCSAYGAAGIEPNGEFCASDNGLCTCENCVKPCAALALHLSGASEQLLSPDDAVCLLEYPDALAQQGELIAKVWLHLPQHVRDSILLLVQAALFK